jgi:thiamine-phosphate pyrophosphorylase
MKQDELYERLKLYLICGEGDDRAKLPEKVTRALEGGVTAVQLRVKTWDARDTYETALALRKITDAHGALFILNDRLDVALASGADGVHLGQKDLPVPAARKIAGRDFIIGATANTQERTKKAQDEGADYIGCGAAFPTGTKQNADVIGPQGIADALRGISIPSVAIGGINADNIEALAHCGCAGISLSQSVMKAPDPKVAALRLVQIIDQSFDRKNSR